MKKSFNLFELLHTDKQCELDPIPTSLLKQCLHLLAPVITNIVNLSLATEAVNRLTSNKKTVFGFRQSFKIQANIKSFIPFQINREGR